MHGTLSRNIPRALKAVAAAAMAALLAVLPVRGQEPSLPGGIIVLDPGHGGNDAGVRGPTGVMEKDLTLALAVGLKERLELNLGAKVILTRSGDYEVTWLERAAMANHNKASLFLSLHMGASTSQAADVFAACYAEPRALAAGGGSVFWQEWKEQNTPFREESRRLAAEVQRALRRWLSRGPEEPRGGDWLVLKGAACPAALVEMGCLTNPERVRAYDEKATMEEMTGVLYDALTGYLG